MRRVVVSRHIRPNVVKNRKSGRGAIFVKWKNTRLRQTWIPWNFVYRCWFWWLDFTYLNRHRQLRQNYKNTYVIVDFGVPEFCLENILQVYVTKQFFCNHCLWWYTECTIHSLQTDRQIQKILYCNCALNFRYLKNILLWKKVSETS